MLVAVLIWLPAAQSGDFYEFTDPLIFMGLPIVTICVAAGALVGVSGAPVSGDGWTRPGARHMLPNSGCRESPLKPVSPFGLPCVFIW